MGKKIVCEDTGEIFHSYKAYLGSWHWARFAVEYFDAAGAQQCVDCGSKRRKIEIHHLHYGTLGREKPADVVALCRICHAKRHDKSPSKPKRRKRRGRKAKKQKRKKHEWSEEPKYRIKQQRNYTNLMRRGRL